MFRRLSAVGVVACLAAIAAPAHAQYQYFENFENGLTGWNLWVERGTQGSAGVGEGGTPLGNIPPFSGANDEIAYVGGPGTGANFNGGIYKTITLPLGAGTYKIDGFWKSISAAANQNWTEIHLWEGTKTFSNGTDYSGTNVSSPRALGGVGGAGAMIYKTDSFTAPYNNSTGWNGQMSATDNNASTPAGVTSFTTTTGTITILLKTGNVGNLGSGAFDDINITPEPSTLLLLALPSVAMLRRRFRHA